MPSLFLTFLLCTTRLRRSALPARVAGIPSAGGRGALLHVLQREQRQVQASAGAVRGGRRGDAARVGHKVVGEAGKAIRHAMVESCAIKKRARARTQYFIF